MYLYKICLMHLFTEEFEILCRKFMALFFMLNLVGFIRGFGIVLPGMFGLKRHFMIGICCILELTKILQVKEAKAQLIFRNLRFFISMVSTKNANHCNRSFFKAKYCKDFLQQRINFYYNLISSFFAIFFKVNQYQIYFFLHTIIWNPKEQLHLSKLVQLKSFLLSMGHKFIMVLKMQYLEALQEINKFSPHYNMSFDNSSVLQENLTAKQLQFAHLSSSKYFQVEYPLIFYVLNEIHQQLKATQASNTKFNPLQTVCQFQPYFQFPLRNSNKTIPHSSLQQIEQPHKIPPSRAQPSKADTDIPSKWAIMTIISTNPHTIYHWLLESCILVSIRFREFLSTLKNEAQDARI